MRKSKSIHCLECAARRGSTSIVQIKEAAPESSEITTLDDLGAVAHQAISFTRTRVDNLRNSISSFLEDLRNVHKIITPLQIKEAVKNSQEYVRAFELSLLMSHDRYQDCKEAHEKSGNLPSGKRLAIQASYLKAEKEYLDLKAEWDRGNQGVQELADSLPELKKLRLNHNLKDVFENHARSPRDEGYFDTFKQALAKVKEKIILSWDGTSPEI